MPGADEGVTVERHSRTVQRRSRLAPLPAPAYHQPMHYELFMGAALGEARAALERGERPHGAAAVLGEALVASSHEEVVSRNDPTAHAVILALREAAKRLATRSLSGLTVFSHRGAVRHVRRRAPRGRCRLPGLCAVRIPSPAPPALWSSWRTTRPSPAGSTSSAGSSASDAAELRAMPRQPRRASRVGRRARRRRTPRRFAILRGGEVSEWLMVPLSKSGVRKHRGFESHPLRHSDPDPTAHRRAPAGPRRTARGEVA